MTAPEFREVASRLSKMLAEAKLAVDSAWERQLFPPVAFTAATLEAAVKRLVDSMDAWTHDDWVRILSGRHTAKRRALDVLDDLKGQGLIEIGTFDRAKTLVDVLFTPNTVYASLAPDDGGVTFYWRAGDMSIEIDIYPGEGYWWRVRNVAAENYSGHGASLEYDKLKYSLTWFSKEVDRANPQWRQQPI